MQQTAIEQEKRQKVTEALGGKERAQVALVLSNTISDFFGTLGVRKDDGMHALMLLLMACVKNGGLTFDAVLATLRTMNENMPEGAAPPVAQA